MVKTLEKHTEASYCYGTYQMNTKEGEKTCCNREFNPEILKRLNYISTMSLIRSEDVIEWDEKIRRLQDWDYWLTLLENGKIGVHCGELIFTTSQRKGITYGSKWTWEMAQRIVKNKHKLI